MPTTKSMTRVWLALAGTIVLAACQSENQVLGNEQGAAMDAAVRRGQFEMGCPTAAGTVISSNVLQPALWGGIERAEYTIGVQGCGKRATYVSVCPIASFGSNNCFAAAGLTNATIGQRL
jgi:hypothetical protein